MSVGITANTSPIAAYTRVQPSAATSNSSEDESEDSSLFVEESSHSEEESNRANELTVKEQQQVEKLKARDAEVRAHEQAHANVGGQYAGAPSYEYDTGPDGKQYAVGGEVQISTSAIPNNPEATIQKMQIVKRAALAPAQPSSQDRQVAQKASSKEANARSELLEERNNETTEQVEKSTEQGEEDKETKETLNTSAKETDNNNQVAAFKAVESNVPSYNKGNVISVIA